MSKIYYVLLACKKRNSSNSGTCPPDLCTNSAEVCNASNSQISQNEVNFFSSQDDDYFLFCRIYNRIRHLRQAVVGSALVGISAQTRNVLTNTEINIPKKGLDFAPIQNKINKPELKKDFEEFCRKMRIKSYFSNDISENFSEKPAVTPKSKWKPPKGHPSEEVLLSQIQKELFELAESPLSYPNFSKKELQAMRLLVDDRSVVIKKADKGSCVVIWDREDYIAKVEIQLRDVTVYKDVDMHKLAISYLQIFKIKGESHKKIEVFCN